MIIKISAQLLILSILKILFQSNGLIQNDELTIPPNTLASLMNFGFLQNGTISQMITVKNN